MSVYKIVREDCKWGKFYIYRRSWLFDWVELRSGGIWRAAFGSRQAAVNAILKQDTGAKIK